MRVNSNYRMWFEAFPQWLHSSLLGRSVCAAASALHSIAPRLKPFGRGLGIGSTAAVVFLSSGLAFAQEQQPEAANPEAHSDAQTAPPGNTSVLSGFMEPFDYDPLGRKDPFAQPTIEKPLPPGSFHGPVLPLQKFKLEELSLTGVIWDVTRPRAMVKDPTGKVHVVGPNTKLGSQNGYIAVIREGEIVVIETYEDDGKLFSSARIVKLSGGDAKAAAH